MEKKEYFLKIAEKVFPDLKTGRFFAKVKGVEHYFSGLIHREVKIIYRSFYDEFDFAFSIRCAFSLCDKKTDARWLRQEGSEHFYSTPALFVVERTEFDYAPAQAVKRMLSRYRANTLILANYSHPHYSTHQLAEFMKKNGLNFLLQNELDGMHCIKIPCEGKTEIPIDKMDNNIYCPEVFTNLAVEMPSSVVA